MSDPNSTKDELRFCRLTRLFVTIALMATIVLPVVIAILNLRFLNGRGLYAVAALLPVGLVLALLDLPRYARKETAEDILRFYNNPHYWAMVVIFSALIVLAFLPPSVQKPVPPRIVVRAKEPAPPKPPEFPDLTVSSVVLNGSRSSAIIDGEVIVVGEDIHNVTLVEVQESSILVRMGDLVKKYPVKGQGDERH